MSTKTPSTKFQLIPLRQLDLSPLNVRKTGADVDIPEFADRIHAQGVLQNLSVYESQPCEGEAETRYAVVAGGRRWRALRLLLDQRRITDDYPVPCFIVAYECAVLISVGENYHEPMHPADEFDAFRQLSDAGQAIEDIAARFGVEPVTVKRRLKLANVHPKLIALYRGKVITLEHLMAFAVTDNQAQQLEVWDGLGAHDRSPSTIRDVLKEHEISLATPMARFVGLKAYQNAGGVVRRDLFAEEDEDLALDADLVRQLATAKLEKSADKVRKQQGVAWVRACLDFDYAARAAYSRVRSVPRDPTEEEQKTLDDIAAELDRIESEVTEAQDQDDPDRVAALDRRAAELEEQDEALNAKLCVPDPQQQSLAGVVVTIGQNGKVEIVRDLLLPEDAKRFAQDERAERRATANGGPRLHSAALVRRLTAQRTLALQATLINRPDVALVALTHRMLLLTFRLYGSGAESAVLVDGRSSGLGPYASELAGSPAEAAIRERSAAIEGQLPKEPKQLFVWLSEQSQTEVLSLLAFCVAQAVYGVQSDETPGATDELARAAGLDMHAWWTPGVKNYLGSLSKARILEILREAGLQEADGPLPILKKGDLALAAEQRLAGTGWLPTLLRTDA